jgi:hypothetical protein
MAAKPKQELPKTVASSEFRIFGVLLHCHVLDNGQRIIEADDMRALMAAMEDPARREPGEDLTPLAHFLRTRG